MEVVFKAINNKTYPYNVSFDDSIESVIEKLYVDANVNKQTHNFKVIYQGKILSGEQKFSEFAPANPKEKVMFVFMTAKNKPAQPTQPVQPVQPTQPVQQTQQSQPVPITVHTQQVPAPNILTQSIFPNSDDYYDDAIDNMDDMDDVDKLRAALFGTLVFIRAQPQMMELFNNNFEAFAQIIMSPQFRPMFETILNDMTVEDEQLDNLTDSVLSHGNHSNSTQQSQTQTVNLSQEDLANIATLEALGFDKQSCLQAYILANKNLDMAASMLMDM